MKTVRLYFRTRRWLQRLSALQQALFDGLWLGLLGPEALDEVDRRCYDSWRQFHGEEHNRQGLFAWEEKAMDAYYRDARRLLLAGAGGGREALALVRAGYEVDAFDPHPELAAAANRLLAAEGFSRSRVAVVPRGECLQGTEPYDGLIVGWSTYMLIRGRDRRVAFLRTMRGQVPAGAPLLVSFYARDPGTRRFRLIAAIGNLLRGILGRRRLEVGDALSPNFTHYFTREEIVAELRRAGFEVVLYGTDEYAHAVARAVADDDRPP